MANAFAEFWRDIAPTSPLITYTGEWNMTDPAAYRPRATMDTVATASMNFSGSGIGWRGAGNAGSTTVDGILYQVDKESSSAWNTTFLLSFTPRNNTRGDSWSDKDLPPGEHTVLWKAQSNAVNVEFRGFDVKVNGTWPADGPTPERLESVMNITAGEVDYFGEKREKGNVTYVTGDDGAAGFAFNFTGLGVGIYGPDTFNETSSWSVYFNESSPPTEPTEPYARFDVEGGQGKGGMIFFAGALPPGQHRVLVVKERGELAFSSAGAYWKDFIGPTFSCTSECADGENKRGVGIGTVYQVVREESGAIRSTARRGVIALSVLALGIDLYL